MTQTAQKTAVLSGTLALEDNDLLLAAVKQTYAELLADIERDGKMPGRDTPDGVISGVQSMLEFTISVLVVDAEPKR